MNSVDQMISAQTGLIPQFTRELTYKIFYKPTIFWVINQTTYMLNSLG